MLRNQDKVTELKCALCDVTFYKKQGKHGPIDPAYDYYCSNNCVIQLMHQRRLAKWADVKTRVEKEINKDPGQGPNGDCWLWVGTINPVNHYGYMMVAGKQKRAHRLVYELFVGPIPKDFVVMHKCDNKPCVNPDHLELGTVKQNSADSSLRGFHEKGEERYNVKLTDEKVRSIRTEWDSGLFRQKDIAKKYGVAQNTIWCITHRTRWKHVV